ncbi:MAG: hypothetical protein U0Z53_16860 [Blastocatellia bacterium]
MDNYQEDQNASKEGMPRQKLSGKTTKGYRITNACLAMIEEIAEDQGISDTAVIELAVRNYYIQFKEQFGAFTPLVQTLPSLRAEVNNYVPTPRPPRQQK